MRKLFLLLLMVTSGIIIVKAQGTSSPGNNFRAAYSSSFEMTNHKYSPLVINLWKDWDNNTIDILLTFLLIQFNLNTEQVCLKHQEMIL